jgi:ribose transport system substrate-binding protein
MNVSASCRLSFAISVWSLLVFSGCPGEVPQPSQPKSGSQPDAVEAGSETSSQPKSVRRIILLTNGNSSFWDAARAGMEDAANELKLGSSGLAAVMEVNDGTLQGQLEKLRQFASQTDIAAVGVSAVDADNVAIAEAMLQLQEQGVPLITFDSDVDRERLRKSRFAFIGTDNLVGGRELGVCARHLRADGGGYVTFVGRTGAQNAIERIGGFAEGAGSSFESLDSMGDGFDHTRARDNVRNAIQNHAEKLTTLVGIWSYNAPAIVDVVREMNKREEMTIVTFDAEPIAVEQMGDGMIDAMIVQNPYQMGYQGVRLLKALVEHDKAVVDDMLPQYSQPDGDIYDTGLKVVVPSADSPLKADMFGKNTKYLTLEEFKKWLDEQGLQGS